MFTDDEIIRSVLEGNTRNFESLIARHGKKMINFINRMIFDPDEAQNIAQDVFLRVYETLPYYKPENNFSAFLFKIAKNQTLNWIKKNKRMVFFSRMMGQDLRGGRFTSGENPERTVEDRQQEGLLTEGLRGLSEDQRLALILKAYLDFSYRQIAGITGWSEPKIETLISRAKSALKKYIALQEKGSADCFHKRGKNHDV
jgi:RNA polymerase sigma-70 factor (ECF subfamily)